MAMKTAFALVLLPVAMLACGGSTKSAAPALITTTQPAPTTTTTTGAVKTVVPAARTCGEVWTTGATLPASFDGTCARTAGDMYVAGSFPCVDGTKLWSGPRVTATAEAWAGRDRVVRQVPQMADDPAYKAEYKACTGR